MAGLNPQTPIPTEIKLHKQSKILEVTFDEGSQFSLPFEYLRVFSPSAEVRGHGPGQETLQVGKKNVDITAVEPVGHYAVVLVFDDKHDSGIYSWDYLYDLGKLQTVYWQEYLRRMEAAGESRESKTLVQ